MPKTELGGLLIAEGLISEERLERALERQRNFGGRIGTCLLEIGALDEGQLLGALSEQLGAPAASIADLSDIPADLIDLLPRSTALNCSAVPFRQSGDRIDIALLDPGNLALEDELSFSTGRRIRSHIANELRIVDALHRYYGGDVPLRFKNLLDLQHAESKPAAAMPPKLSPVPAYLRPGASSSSKAASRVRHFTPPKFAKQAIQLTPEERAALELTSESIGGGAAPTPAPSQPHGDGGHELYGQQLSRAETASEIGTALIRFLAQSFTRVLLFRVSSGSDEVTGWMSHGPGIDLEWFRHYSVGLHHATVFRDLSEGREAFAGRLLETPAHKALARCWDGSTDRDCVMLPVSVRGKLVCVAYADRGYSGLEDVDLGFLQKVAGKTALAFERCILRRKLQAT